MTKIKLCGMTRPEDVEAALKRHPDAEAVILLDLYSPPAAVR